MGHIVQSIDDWLFALATVSVPILTFVIVMYLLIKMQFLGANLTKLEAVQTQLHRDMIELHKAVAALEALAKKN